MATSALAEVRASLRRAQEELGETKAALAAAQDTMVDVHGKQAEELEAFFDYDVLDCAMRKNPRMQAFWMDQLR